MRTHNSEPTSLSDGVPRGRLPLSTKTSSAVAGAIAVVSLVSTLIAAPSKAEEDSKEASEGIVLLSEDTIGAPMRVRDFTFPSYLVLSFAPQPAAAIGKGKWALEAHYSVVNDFQVSPTVEDYLEETRGNEKRALDEVDAAFILGLPEGEGYYIDGEFSFLDVMFHYGVTHRLDVGIGFYAIDFTGGGLDGTIFDFHDQFGFGQQGRDFIPDGQFQIVLGQDGEGLVVLDGPPSGGVSDPSLYLRYSLPDAGQWKFSLSGGFKIPLADKQFLSSGGFDLGVTLTADRRWSKNALIFNLGAVEAEEFSNADFDPPILPSLNVSWLRTLGSSRRTRVFVQALAAQHAFRDLLDSEISDLELQVTVGVKRATKAGVFGIGLTENVLSYDNTPDIGVHFSWGYLSD